MVLDASQDPSALQPVWVKTDLVCSHVLERILMICPFLISFFPSSDVLHDQIWALLNCLGDSDMSIQAKSTCWIVDRNEPLPLLNGERLIRRYVQADHFALGVKGIEVDVSDDPQRT